MNMFKCAVIPHNCNSTGSSLLYDCDKHVVLRYEAQLDEPKSTGNRRTQADKPNSLTRRA